jgi:hypothetical protein
MVLTFAADGKPDHFDEIVYCIHFFLENIRFDDNLVDILVDSTLKFVSLHEESEVLACEGRSMADEILFK